ncbi:MAG TPA: xanthine dehydrogenase family protein subunit M [Chloroflexota bacterium]|jgi:CO/xanthine dehydrogenase FAD-binding subunit
MKPAAFDYYAPNTVDEALELLAQLGEDAKPLAGGQSLVPMMNFRLARPASLIDLNRIAELDHLAAAEDGSLRIRAMTRQRSLERSAAVARQWPLIAEAVAHIGHVQIRNRGTVGGSLSHADPAAELPAVMVALDAELVIHSRTGQRMLSAADFFLGHYQTAVEPSELLVEVRVPLPPARTGWSFQEVSRRHGDFALAGAAGLVTLDQHGAISRARLAFVGLGPTPIRSIAAEDSLVGQQPSDSIWGDAAALASRDLDPDADVHATAAYRRHLGEVLARRVLIEAAKRASAAP